MAWGLAAFAIVSALASGYATYKSHKTAKQARDTEKSTLKDQEQKAKEAEELIKKQEAERKRRLIAAGTQKPSTLLGSYAGLPRQEQSLLG